ncbi:hypothetical protein TSUD_201820 [Trifolium subterraneum]|uniref:DYW domain-containing protein n=1 Tax=Trifolium subterraneum TaxID=3900 RepID=A0A2Z6LLA6_TRISU|nr:hypothetical protein TSUD_201820 [Trifolium subterraneum]
MILNSSSGRLSRNTLISLINKACTFPHLTQIHTQLILNGYHYDIATVTKLTQKLFDFGATRHARALFFSVPKPDIFLFNVLVRGFSLNASPSSSISLYAHLRRNTNLVPDNFTYAFAVAACSEDKHLMLLHAHSIIDGYGSNVFVGSTLVDLYCKFWRVGFARKVFDGMPERDTVLWNTMINGLVKNCCFDDSIQLFGDMVAQGVKLDSSAVTAVLPAVAELQELRVGMGIQCLALKIGFNRCDYVLTGLISLYAKCGDVNTARLLFGMISKPDLIAYNAMISGFTSNGETECSVKLFKELLFSSERVSSSTIVGLIPLHSPFGHLHLACSIHGFCVKSDIYAKLEKLTGKMREMGYQSETVPALHDVEEEEKELAFNVHSEKLAIAFGLITTEPGTDIRIIKNLRVCLDCHTATKLISKITERVIVVRDANRFHHFKDGICSCGDYW